MIVVTGGAGFIGSHLVDELLRRQAGPVRIVDNFSRGSSEKPRQRSNRVELVRCDIADAGALARAFRDAAMVFHLAACANVMSAEERPELCFDSNVLGTRIVLETARHAGVDRVVFTSSREVYGDPQALPVAEHFAMRPKNQYGASKAAGEMYCRMYNGPDLEVAVLRLSNVYGPGDHGRVIPNFVDAALSGRPITIYGGEQIIDFVWVGYVVEALIGAAFGPRLGEPVNIGSGGGTSLFDLARRIVELTGSNTEIRIAPRRDAEVTSYVADVRRARERLSISPASDPLSHLADVIEQAVSASHLRSVAV